MTSLAAVNLRPLLESELCLANRWAIEEGWNPGPKDAAVFNAADPGSLITLEIEGVPVGVISACCMTEDYGFVGFFVLCREHRRARNGWNLMQASLERMGDRVIGSETIFQLVRTYAHYGLRPHYHTVAHHGMAPERPAAWARGVEFFSPEDFRAVVEYDTQSTGVVREAFLREWFALPDSRVLVFKRDGKIRGIGAARKCYHGVRIGPLQADDPLAAESLYDALSGLAPGEVISMDCPDINPDSARLARVKGLQAGSATARLYRGNPPEGRLNRVYGLMSYALG